MKRSEINAALKEMEQMIREYRHSVISHRKSGRKKDMITMRSATIC